VVGVSDQTQQFVMAPRKKVQTPLSPNVSSPSSKPRQANEHPVFGLVQRMPQDEGHILPDGDGKIAQLVLYRKGNISFFFWFGFENGLCYDMNIVSLSEFLNERTMKPPVALESSEIVLVSKGDHGFQVVGFSKTLVCFTLFDDDDIDVDDDVDDDLVDDNILMDSN